MSQLARITSACTRIAVRDEAEINRIIIRDETEIKMHMRRLHVHMTLLCVGVVAISMMVTADVGELTIFCVTWLLTGCQEYADALGLM